MIKIKKKIVIATNARRRSKKQITHMLMGRISKWYESFENSFKILIKLSMQLPFDPANVLLDIFPKELKSLVQVKNKKPKNLC